MVALATPAIALVGFTVLAEWKRRKEIVMNENILFHKAKVGAEAEKAEAAGGHKVETKMHKKNFPPLKSVEKLPILPIVSAPVTVPKSVPKSVNRSVEGSNELMQKLELLDKEISSIRMQLLASKGDSTVATEDEIVAEIGGNLSESENENESESESESETDDHTSLTDEEALMQLTTMQYVLSTVLYLRTVTLYDVGVSVTHALQSITTMKGLEAASTYVQTAVNSIIAKELSELTEIKDDFMTEIYDMLGAVGINMSERKQDDLQSPSPSLSQTEVPTVPQIIQPSTVSEIVALDNIPSEIQSIVNNKVQEKEREQSPQFDSALQPIESHDQTGLETKIVIGDGQILSSVEDIIVDTLSKEEGIEETLAAEAEVDVEVEVEAGRGKAKRKRTWFEFLRIVDSDR